MAIILLCLFLNSFLSAKVIINRADQEQTNKKYQSAIFLYKLAYPYYSINHFSSVDKDFYMKIPYEISICELREHNTKKSEEIIFKTYSKIQKKYGYYSKENSDFIRKYLIEYYLTINNTTYAKRELLNLFSVYKEVNCDINTKADLLRLAGDIYYQQKDYYNAVSLYEKAYSVISKEPEIDFEVYTKIVHRICDYEIKNNRADNAIDFYKNALSFLQKSKEPNNESIVNIYINLGELYSRSDNNLQQAIASYENAIKLIKELPRGCYLRQNLYVYYNSLKDLYNRNNQSYKATQIDVELARMRRFSLFYY